jgi:hypothetical protein
MNVLAASCAVANRASMAAIAEQTVGLVEPSRARGTSEGVTCEWPISATTVVVLSQQAAGRVTNEVGVGLALPFFD